MATQTDSTGATNNHDSDGAQRIVSVPIIASKSGVLVSVGVNIESVGSGGSIGCAIYSQLAGSPNILLGYANVQAATTGWNDLVITSATVNIVAGATYWIAFNTQNSQISWYYGGSASNDVVSAGSYPGFINPFVVVSSFNESINMRMTYTLSVTSTLNNIF